jgi:hypothetical protein
MKIIINFGLLPSPGSANPMEQTEIAWRAAQWADKALKGNLLSHIHYTRGDLLVEPTLVIEGQWRGGLVRLHESLAALADELGQDCIAYMAERIDHEWGTTRMHGGLAGPRAEHWAPFNQDLFFTIPKDKQ